MSYNKCKEVCFQVWAGAMNETTEIYHGFMDCGTAVEMCCV